MLSQERFNTLPPAKPRKTNPLPENPEADDPNSAVKRGRFPSWLHRKLPQGGQLAQTGTVLEGDRLHTVCEEAKCPNQLECWTRKTATFLVMGKECTRNCGFCEIDFSSSPKALEEDEPQRVAESVKALGLKHVVITMVARDDLPDGGAKHIRAILEEVRRQAPQSTLEVLTWDFNGDLDAVDEVLRGQPEIYNYNTETVRELSPRVRHRATYDRTLMILEHVKKKSPQTFVKSGLMVGLGETEEQVRTTLKDLQKVGVDIVTMGQYLQPSRQKLRVKAFIPPEQFERYADYGRSIGIQHMYCGPFVRSSYNAASVLEQALSTKNNPS